MRIYFVTSNRNKFREAESLLAGIDVHRLALDIPEIQSVSLEEVAIDKAKKAYQKVKKPVVVEDTGLFLSAFGGFPGALWKWMFMYVGREGTCKIINSSKNHAAYTKTVVCMYDGKTARTFEGRTSGRISDRIRGESEFGFDPIFIPSGRKTTFAEMTEKEKNSISHRGKAFRKLKRYLSNSNRR